MCFLSMFEAIDRVQQETEATVQKLKLAANALALLKRTPKKRQKQWREIEDGLQAVTAELVALPQKLDGIFRSEVVESIGKLRKVPRLDENAGGSLHDYFVEKVGILAEMWFLNSNSRPSKKRMALETAAADTINNIECRGDDVELNGLETCPVWHMQWCGLRTSNDIVECALDSFHFELATSDIQPMLHDHEVKDAIERAQSRTVSEIFATLKMDVDQEVRDTESGDVEVPQDVRFERDDDEPLVAQACAVSPARRWAPSLRSGHWPIQGQENIVTEISWCTEHFWEYECQDLMVHAFALWTFATNILWRTPAHALKWKPSLRSYPGARLCTELIVKYAFHVGFKMGTQAYHARSNEACAFCGRRISCNDEQ